MKASTMLWMKTINEMLKDLEITYYDNVEKIQNEPGMTPTKIRSFLNKEKRRNQSNRGYYMAA